jgi:hypothetical protein
VRQSTTILKEFTPLKYVDHDSNYNINCDISGGFKEVRQTTTLALSLNCGAKSHQDDAKKYQLVLLQTQPR